VPHGRSRRRSDRALKVATRWNRVALAGALEAADLVELATANPGDTLARPWKVPVEPDLRAEATKWWRTGLAELERVWLDPGGAVRRARGAREFGVEPLRFTPDLPGPDGSEARALTDDELDQLAMPAFDGIGHDAAWFRRLRRSCPKHADVLLDLGTEF
jgi:hypothetical protein